jgi:hypothetical protein
MWSRFLNATTGLSFGFLITAAWFGDLAAVLLFVVPAWLSLTAWLRLDTEVS